MGARARPRSELSAAPRVAPGTTALLAAALALATAALYARVAGFEFVNYDDSYYVTENWPIQQGLARASAWALTARHASNWHPLTWLSHALDFQAFGLWAGGHHLVSAALHVANTVLLFLVLLHMTGSPGRSALVAAVFALHPLHVESVAWVAERKDVLSTLFWFLTMASWLRWVRRPRLGAYLLALACLALGLAAKPMLVTLPLVLLLLDLWPLGRLRAGRPWPLVREKLPLFALSAASSVVTYAVQQRWGSMSDADLVPLGARLSNALVAYAGYLRQTVWPTELAVIYPHPVDALPAWKVAAAGALLAALTALAIAGRRRRPHLTVGWLWFLGTLVPVIGLVQVGAQAMADRYTYVPMVGLVIALAWSVPDCMSGRPVDRLVRVLVAGAWLAGLGATASVQLSHWADSEKLFRHALAVTDDNHIAHQNLANHLLETGRVDEAMGHYRETLRLRPTYVEALSNLATALTRKGLYAEAADMARRATELKPSYADAHYNLGVCLYQLGRVDEAIRSYERALVADPLMARAHHNLGAALVQKHALGEARDRFEEALRLYPDFLDAHYNLGVVLLELDDAAGAALHFQEALRLDPANERARTGLAVARQRLGGP
ncbi:MAG: tetratricopeptide repeat protein [Planctomycetes bacterium]|nr:tetratricopeptide repeat protein [Planctomycetota bacterium]